MASVYPIQSQTDYSSQSSAQGAATPEAGSPEWTNALLTSDPQTTALGLVGTYNQLGVAEQQWFARNLAGALQPEGSESSTTLLAAIESTEGSDQLTRAMQGESQFLSSTGSTSAASGEPMLLSANAQSPEAQQRELLLDLTQLGLGIAGIADQTGISDGIDTVISFGRGDWFGGILSGVSIIPVLGDLAKVGKLGKWAETVVKAVDLAASNADFAKRLHPVLRQIDRVLDQIPMDKLPGFVREPLEKIRNNIDRFFSGAGLEEGAGWRQRGEAPESWNVSRADGSINDCNWCSLEIVTGLDRNALASAAARMGIEPGQRMSAAELGKVLKNVGLIDDTKSLISGSKAAVIGRMEQFPVGQYFTLTLSNNGLGGHNVIARRTQTGIEILDGQVNQTYRANSVAGMSTWEAFPLNGVRNPNL